MTGEDVIKEALERVRAKFYELQPARFAQDREFLVKALTIPAEWLHSRAVAMPAKWHAEIIRRILDEAEKFATGLIKYTPGYLMKCVQDHMRHQGERYYNAAKATPRAVGKVVRQISRETQEEAAIATLLLAEVHRIAGRKVKAQRETSSRETQKELF